MKLIKKRKPCKDCGDPTTATWCKPCGYKNMKRPSGLVYHVKQVNRGWFRPGVIPWNKGAATPRPDRWDGYLKLLGKKHHRVVMEIELGRELATNEEVHHMDGDKANNDLSNLQVMEKSEHLRYHWNTNWAHRRKQNA